MKRLVLAGFAFALVVPAFAVPAFADPTVAPVPAGAHRVKNPGVYVVPTVTVYGRPGKPMVNIEIRTPPATEAAAAAHAQLHNETVARTEPRAP